MKRVYISGWEDKEPVGMMTPVEIFLTGKAEEAHPWPSKEQAQSQAKLFLIPMMLRLTAQRTAENISANSRLKSIHRKHS